MKGGFGVLILFAVLVVASAYWPLVATALLFIVSLGFFIYSFRLYRRDKK